MIRRVLLRPLEWLADRLMPDVDPHWDATDMPAYASDSPCTCTPPSVAQHGDRRETCLACGGRVVYLSAPDPARLTADEVRERQRRARRDGPL